jgi:hypothetical protein
LAGEEKNRLEEKQRAARRERKKRRDEWTPQYGAFMLKLLFFL